MPEPPHCSRLASVRFVGVCGRRSERRRRIELHRVVQWNRKLCSDKRADQFAYGESIAVGEHRRRATKSRYWTKQNSCLNATTTISPPRRDVSKCPCGYD